MLIRNLIRTALVFLCTLFVSVPPAFAQKVSGPPFRGRVFSNRDIDITKPQNKEEVLRIYGWLVNTKNGVNKKEATLIAQREMVLTELYRDFDAYKPKVLRETKTEWVIRFPAKFSLSGRDNSFIYFFTIAKSNGNILSSGEKKEE